MIRLNESPVNAVLGRASQLLLPLAVLVVGFVLFGGLMALKKPPAEAENQSLTPKVSTVAASEYNGMIEIVASGLVVPYREITVSTQVEGIILEKSTNCEAGQYVESGKMLLQIDPTNYQIAVDELTASHEQAIAQVAEIDIQLENSANQIERLNQELAVREREKRRIEEVSQPGVYSQRDFDNAEWNYLKAVDSVASIQEQTRLLTQQKQRLLAAQEIVAAKLNRAEIDLERCEIVAPSNGIVISEMAEPGAYVSRSTSLLQFEDTSKVEIECNLRIDEVQTILENAPQPLNAFELPGNVVIVEFDTGAGTVAWEGKLARYNGAGLDQTTRTVPCVIEVDQPTNADTKGFNTLVRGMYVTTRIQIEPISPMVAIPAVARQSQDAIWVVDREDRLQRIEVEEMNVPISALGGSQSSLTNDEQDWIVVRASGGSLPPGSRIVVSPIAYATERQKVEIDNDAFGTIVESQSTRSNEDDQASTESGLDTADNLMSSQYASTSDDSWQQALLAQPSSAGGEQ